MHVSQRGSGRKKMRVKVYEARLFQQYIWTEDELSDLKVHIMPSLII